MPTSRPGALSYRDYLRSFPALRKLYRAVKGLAGEPSATAFPSAEALPARLARIEQELSVVYGALYEMAHDNDEAAAFAARKTVAAFSHQWASIPDGKFMLSDPVFKAEVDRIITQQELLIDALWFPGKRVLDAGCGGGRWSYGLAKLGAHVTAVDTNPSALAATRTALTEIEAPAEFVQSPLEDIDRQLPAESFDLVWSWGVLHHCTSFTRSLRALAALVKPGGLIHLYLYGRASMNWADDVTLFKERLRYNFLPTDAERQEFLRVKSRQHGLDVHHVHDIYSPLINRRYAFSEVEAMLEQLGFTSIQRPIEHTEVWITAVKGDDAEVVRRHGLPKHPAPYWFERT